MSDYINIIYLVIIWFFGWWAYFYSSKKGWRLAKNADLSIVYFLFLSFFTFLSIKKILPFYIINNLPTYFFIVLLVFITVNHIYFIIREKFKEPLVLINNHPTDHWLEANRQSIFITSSHIIFQQIIITGLVFALNEKISDLFLLGKSFTLIFGVLHLPLIFFKGFKFMILYTLPAAIAGFIFAVLLVEYPYGFILNYIIHWVFYAFITYAFWKYQDKIKV